MNDSRSQEEWREAFVGVLMGTAVGDALGLPAEGMSPGRVKRRWHGRWQHRFFLGRGMVSDDTEHTLFVAQALLAHPDNPDAFQRCLAWKFRLWLLGVPAGIGLATLRATLKLWMGFPAGRSGVFSAGNGPAMRSAILGAYFADDPVARRQFVAAATRLAHTDPRAETAALAVAEAVARTIRREPPKRWLAELPVFGKDDEWQSLCDRMATAFSSGQTVSAFAISLGLEHGVTGYAYHSVPVALYASLCHPDNFRVAVESALNCGGDTDTIGAIAGAACGARTGRRGIPEDWLVHLRDWPRSTALLEQVAERLAMQKATGRSAGPVAYFWPGLILRNLLFLGIVLLHALRRVLPPY